MVACCEGGCVFAPTPGRPCQARVTVAGSRVLSPGGAQAGRPNGRKALYMTVAAAAAVTALRAAAVRRVCVGWRRCGCSCGRGA